MITTPLIPVMISLNTFYQQQRKREEAKLQEHKEETKPNYPNYNRTSCVQDVYENAIECCFYPPLPPETQANMVTVCNVLSR